MKKRSVALLLALAMLFSLAACAGNGTAAPDVQETPGVQETPPVTDTQPTETPEAVPATRMFTDDCGREVEIPTEIRAIVPSGPLAQIVLFAIAPDLFVGLADAWNDCAKGFIAEEYFSLPSFGQLYGSTELNVEELAAAAPQLIIDVGEAKKSVVEDMDTLQAQTAIPSVHIEATLKTMPEVFRTLGALLGKEDKGEALAQFCEKTYERTVSVMEQVGDNKVKALYILGEEGLNVIANGSYHAELIDMLTDNLAVVDNPVGKGTGNAVTMEQLALWNPEFVLFGSGSIYGTVSEMGTWKELTAIANGNYVEVPEGPHNWMGNPPSVQRYLSLIWLTAVLYPEYCDYDVMEEVQTYYELFYGAELTAEQFETLTANAFLK